MTATQAPSRRGEGAHAGAPAPRPRGLLRAELRRLWSRRFVRVVLLLAAVGYLGGVAIAFTQFARPTPEDLAQAETALAAAIEENEQFRQQCLEDFESSPENFPEGESPDLVCGPPIDEQGLELAWFLDRQPFALADQTSGGALAVAVATAAVLFVVAATSIGAEWSTRSMAALLFWEPRRLRVMGVKAGVAAGFAAAVAALAQVVWVGAAVLLARLRGTTDVDDAFWGDVVAQAARCVGFVVLIALLGFGLAHLLRNTGAALGVAFGYFVVAETAVRVLAPSAQPFLVTDSSLALLSEGGWTIFLPGTAGDSGGEFFDSGREVLLSNARGGLTLLLYAAVLLAVGTWSFRRRDLH